MKTAITSLFSLFVFFMASCINAKTENIEQNDSVFLMCDIKKCKNENISLYPASKNGKHGYINNKGVVVIGFTFKECGFFTREFAPFAQVTLEDNSIAYIDKDGNIYNKLPSDLTNSFYYKGVTNKLLDDQGKFCLIDINGNRVTSDVYDFISLPKCGLFRFKKGGGIGFLNEDGKIIIPPMYKDAGDFYEGLAKVKINGKYGYINTKDEIVILNTYTRANDFSEGLAAVSEGSIDDGTSKTGYINQKGEVVIPFKFGDAKEFNEGIARVTRKGDYFNHAEGLIDKQGNLLCPYIFKKSELFGSNFHCGRAHYMIEKNGTIKEGFIDKKGKLVIPAIYDIANVFRDGLAFVEKDGKSMYIDINGKIIWTNN